MARPRAAEYHVVATYPEDMEAAGAAITALERGGVEAANISLLGRAAERAQTDPDPRERDVGVAKVSAAASADRHGRRHRRGGVGGLRRRHGGLRHPRCRTGDRQRYLGCHVGRCRRGGGRWRPDGGHGRDAMSPDWETTYQESLRAGHVLVGVHADGPRAADRAEDLLRHADPLRVDRFDAPAAHRGHVTGSPVGEPGMIRVRGGYDLRPHR
jgi:hypothetical protein